MGIVIVCGIGGGAMYGNICMASGFDHASNKVILYDTTTELVKSLRIALIMSLPSPSPTP